MRWIPTFSVLALAAATGCTTGDTSDTSDASATEAAEAVSQPAGGGGSWDVPAAILGQAPALRGEELRYLDGDENTVGYYVEPDGEGPFPAVILIHEWNGLVDRVREVADAMAAEGYVALAADLYQGRTGNNPEENMALVRESQADMDYVIRNLNAAAAYVRARPNVTGRVGTVGWCFGGGIALSYGLGGENHDATAIFYGGLVDDPEALRAMDHEVYGTFAALDQGPSPEDVAGFEEALRAAGIENDLHIYDDVNHGFWLRVDEDPQTRGPAAEDAWGRLKAYFGRTLGTP